MPVAIALGADKKTLSDQHFVFFNNLRSPEGSIEHLGDNTTGSGDGDDRGAGDPAVTATTSSAPTPAAGASDAVPAEISGFRFEPEEIRVAAGGEVRWTNADEVRHTVTADDGTFDLGLDGVGSAGSHRFAEPGTHAYHCSVHPSMTGTVLVD